jgi:hypothetical protein
MHAEVSGLICWRQRLLFTRSLFEYLVGASSDFSQWTWMI